MEDRSPTLCADCKTRPVEIVPGRDGKPRESLWCAECKAKLTEALRGKRIVQS